MHRRMHGIIPRRVAAPHLLRMRKPRILQSGPAASMYQPSYATNIVPFRNYHAALVSSGAKKQPSPFQRGFSDASSPLILTNGCIMVRHVLRWPPNLLQDSRKYYLLHMYALSTLHLVGCAEIKRAERKARGVHVIEGHGGQWRLLRFVLARVSTFEGGVYRSETDVNQMRR